MSERDDIVKIIQNNDVQALIQKAKNIRDIDSANIRITIHDAKAGNNNQGRNDNNQQLLIPEDGLTLLHVAAYYNSFECFRYLQQSRQISLRKQSSHSFLPIHYACWAGACEVSLYILTEDPSQSSYIVQGADDLQLIYCSIIGGDTEVLETLFEKGATLTVQNQDRLLKKAIGLINRPDIFKIIYSHYIPKHGSVDTPPIIKAIIDHNPLAFETIYSGKDDIICKSPDKSNDNLIGLICENDRDKKFKNILITKVLKDAKEMNLEPTNSTSNGICHWACYYLDVEVANMMFKLPNCNINRLANGKTGPLNFINRKEKAEVNKMIDCLIDNGFNINDTHGGRVPTLLESFLNAIMKNLDAIQLLINRGADINAPYLNPRSKKKQTLYEFVMNMGGSNEPLKKIFRDAHDNH